MRQLFFITKIDKLQHDLKFKTFRFETLKLQQKNYFCKTNGKLPS